MTNKKADPAWIYLAIIATVLFVGIALHDVYESDKTVIPYGYVSPEKLQSLLDAKSLEVTESKDIVIADKDLIIANLTSQLVGTSTGIIKDIKDSSGYLIDGIFLEVAFEEEKLSDRELSLFDGEVDFDGENYDAQEFFIIQNIELKANDKDFEGVPYLIFEKDSLVYTFEFEEGFTENISDDETLVFNLLGEEVEISSWEEDKITFIKGYEFEIIKDETVDLEDYEIFLDNVYSSGSVDKIRITVNGETKTIREEETATIDGLEVYVKEILNSGYSGGSFSAIIVVGEDVENTIDNADEYSKDSIWEWVIDQNSIGLRLVEDFKELDDEFKPLYDRELICLPNDYICVRYNGVIEVDRLEYDLEIDSDGFIRIDGEFEVGIEDYEVLYIDTYTGKFYEDDEVDEEEEIIGDIDLGNSDYELIADASGFTIAMIEFNYSLSSLYDTTDEDFMTDEGVIIYNPEDSFEDEEYTISIPEEKLEATLTIL